MTVLGHFSGTEVIENRMKRKLILCSPSVFVAKLKRKSLDSLRCNLVATVSGTPPCEIPRSSIEPIDFV